MPPLPMATSNPLKNLTSIVTCFPGILYSMLIFVSSEMSSMPVI